MKDSESRMETVAVIFSKVKEIEQKDNRQMGGNAREMDRLFTAITHSSNRRGRSERS